MRRITVNLAGRSYDILIGSGMLGRLGEFVSPLNPTSIHVVCTDVVAPLYAQAATEACRGIAPTHLCTIADGEAIKNLSTVSMVLDALASARADRRSVLVALGGGVVGDIAGFAASIYMRGIRFVQVPTTLLAQVDSSVGGKTGVNHPNGKNLIGSFHQPSVVVSDTATLQTLPAREVRAGLAEILKHGLLADRDYFDRTVEALPKLLVLEAAALAEAIAGSCEIKAAVVGRDERESGERALLNLGHTFGHAIEALTGYRQWLHGEAVACGLCLAADLSARLAMIGPDAVDRITAAVAHAGLPTRIAGISRVAAFEAMRADKKALAGRIDFVLLERIGQAVRRQVDDAFVEATLSEGGFV
ncbi:3-dehydroquinate synthase [Burkholderiales bacterium]|nr:3-dehydroquinate synthase [Burkholderiales bacterium]